MKHLFAVVVVVGCGSGGSSAERHAVGTYIGSAADGCEYQGKLSVFDPNTPVQGPRFIRGPGTITVKCPNATREVAAVLPTTIRITGAPKSMKVGDKATLTAHFIAGKHDLLGEARTQWTAICPNIIELGPVQDADLDRRRELIALGKGKCQLTVGLMTGRAEENFQGQGWQDTILVVVE